MKLIDAGGWVQGESTTLHSYGVFADRAGQGGKYVLAFEDKIFLDGSSYRTCITDDEGISVSVDEGGDGG